MRVLGSSITRIVCLGLCHKMITCDMRVWDPPSWKGYVGWGCISQSVYMCAGTLTRVTVAWTHSADHGIACVPFHACEHWNTQALGVQRVTPGFLVLGGCPAQQPPQPVSRVRGSCPILPMSWSQHPDVCWPSRAGQTPLGALGLGSAGGPQASPLISKESQGAVFSVSGVESPLGSQRSLGLA